MEPRSISIKEALTFMFQKGWFEKALGALLWFIPVIIFQILNLGSQSKSFQGGVLSIIGVFALALLSFFSTIVLLGYLILYMHDRALDTEAKWRNWTECVPDAIFAGLKAQIYFIATIIPFYILTIIVTAASIFIPVIGFFIAFPLIFALFIFYIWFTVKVMTNYVKDLKLSSLFKWGNAFALSRDVKLGFMPVLVFIGLSILYFGLIIAGTIPAVLSMQYSMMSGAMPNAVPEVPKFLFLFMTPGVLMLLYIYLYSGNIIGQLSYNSIEANLGIAPESLKNKPIHTDKIITVIIACVLFCIPLFIGIAAALTLPSLIARQNELEVKTKIMKATTNYENVVIMYKAETGRSNAVGLMAPNCTNASDYFFIKTQDGCNFVTADGVYWQFNAADGSVIIADDAQAPTKTLKMGVCINGEVNCQYDYPEAYEIKPKNMQLSDKYMQEQGY